MGFPEVDQSSAERHIIGNLLQYPERAHEIFGGTLTETYFRNKHYAAIFKHAKRIHEAGRTISTLNLRREFQENGGPPAWLEMTIMDAMADAQSYPGVIEDASRIMVDATHLAKIREQAARAHTIEDWLAFVQFVAGLEQGRESSNVLSIGEILRQSVERQEGITAGSIEAGYSFGIPALDYFVRLEPCKFYVIAGIKKGGKSLFLLHVLRHNFEANVPCYLFTLEMAHAEIGRKYLSTKTRIDSHSIYTKYLPAAHVDEMRAAAKRGKDLPCYVNDNPVLGTPQLLRDAMRWKYQQNVPDGEGIIGVDFLQLVENTRERGESEASALKRVAYDLARMAKQLKCAVIAAAQFRNEAEGQEPHLRFLEGSGAIAQAAEAILIVDYPERRTDERTKEWPKDYKIIVAAQRTGESGKTIECKVDLRTGDFREVDQFGS